MKEKPLRRANLGQRCASRRITRTNAIPVEYSTAMSLIAVPRSVHVRTYNPDAVRTSMAGGMGWSAPVRSAAMNWKVTITLGPGPLFFVTQCAPGAGKKRIACPARLAPPPKGTARDTT